MLKLFTAITKELLLLRRDRTGLLVLFLMPAILVVVITAVQENVMELTGQKKTRLVLLDKDQGELGRSLQNRLAEGNLEIIEWDADRREAADVRKAVMEGDFQVGVVVPEGLSARFEKEEAALFLPGSGQQQEKSGSRAVAVFLIPAS